MRNTILCLFGAATLGLYSCDKSGVSSTPSQSAVMFVNAISTSSKTVALYGTNGATSLHDADSLWPVSCSPYIYVNSNSSIGFKPLGGVSLPGSSVGVNVHSSFFAYGPLSDLQTQLVGDDLIAPAPGTAKVRFANLCSGTPTISCYFAGYKIDSPIAYKTVDPYMVVTPGAGLLYIKDPKTPAHNASITNQSFLDNKIYTVIFTDTAADGLSGFRITVISNN